MRDTSARPPVMRHQFSEARICMTHRLTAGDDYSVMRQCRVLETGWQRRVGERSDVSALTGWRRAYGLSDIRQLLLALPLLMGLCACASAPKEPPPDDPFQSMTDPAAAIVRLKEKVKNDPQNASAWFELGQSYVTLNRFTDAVEPLQQAAQLAPTRGDCWAMLALALKRSERVEDAALAYGKALSCSPDSAEYLASYRELMEAQGLHEEFIARVATIVKNRPAGIPVLNGIAQEYVQAGRGRAGEAAAMASLSIQSDQAPVRLLLGKALEQQERYQPAMRAYSEYLQLEPSGIEGVLGMGRAAYGALEMETAQKYFALALKLAPDRMDAAYGMILVALKTDDLSQASNLLRKALEVAPGAFVLQLAQAELYLKQGHPDQALTLLTMAQPHAPQDRRLNELLVRAWLEAGQPARALEVLDGALARDGKNMRWIRLRCHALNQGGYKSLFDAECQGVEALDEFSHVKDGPEIKTGAPPKSGAKKARR